MNNIKEVLNQELAQLENARDVLQYSYEKCCRIGAKIGKEAIFQAFYVGNDPP